MNIKMVQAPCLSVLKVYGERALKLAMKLKILNKDLKVNQDRGYVIIPLVRGLSSGEVAVLNRRIEGIKVAAANFHKKMRRPRSLLEALSGKLPNHLLVSIPHSMDIIGSVAILKVPPELVKYERLLGKAVIEVHKRVITVLASLGTVDGEYRLRDYKVIAGVGETETMYREYGCIYYLDPTKVYFSPRLSQERWRITQQVLEGETIIDMFTGVGPFSILIGKKSRNTKVFAIDINPYAYVYLKKNIVANRVTDSIIPLFGDVRDIIKGCHVGVADRVIMNLPEKSIEFVDVACKALKSEGGILHYYGFEVEPDALGKAVKKLNKAFSRTGRVIQDFSCLRLVRPVAPHKWQVAVDVVVC